MSEENKELLQENEEAILNGSTVSVKSGNLESESNEESNQPSDQDIIDALARDIVIICNQAIDVVNKGTFTIQGASDAYLLQNMCEAYIDRLVKKEESNEESSTES